MFESQMLVYMVKSAQDA